MELVKTHYECSQSEFIIPAPSAYSLTKPCTSFCPPKMPPTDPPPLQIPDRSCVHRCSIVIVMLKLLRRTESNQLIFLYRDFVYYSVHITRLDLHMLQNYCKYHKCKVKLHSLDHNYYGYLPILSDLIRIIKVVSKRGVAHVRSCSFWDRGIVANLFNKVVNKI